MAGFDEIRLPWQGWKIIREIGKGTFGTVYEIERQLFDTTEKAALKVISIPRDENELDMMFLASGYNEDAVEQSIRAELRRVEREYALMSKMKGISNIVSCDDFAYMETESGKGYTVFIRMELLKSIQNVIKEKRREGIPFTEKETIKLGIDISRALVVCEKYGIIHRDIKPHNILISSIGAYNLGDFGTARNLDHSTHATYAGTLSFMAPEVFKRQKYGKTVDIYSLGLVMYWLVNGYRMPFITPGRVPTAEDIAVAENKRMSGEPLPAPSNAGAALSNVILKACAYRSEDRYGSAADMLSDLMNLESGTAAFTHTAKPAERIVYKVYPGERRNEPQPGFDETLPLFDIGDSKINSDELPDADTVITIQNQPQQNGIPQDNKPKAEKKPDDNEPGRGDYQIGMRFYNKEDYGVAAHWFRKAAKKGYTPAQSMMGLFCCEGLGGVEKDYKTAVMWLEKAANQGDSKAQTLLADCYMKGSGVRRSNRKAVKLYLEAAQNGDPVAQNSIGECYYFGYGVFVNNYMAVNWFRKAAEQGNADAQNNLGMCYQHRKGVDRDLREAEEWYQKAAAQGHQKAIKNLSLVQERIKKEEQWWK